LSSEPLAQVYQPNRTDGTSSFTPDLIGRGCLDEVAIREYPRGRVTATPVPTRRPRPRREEKVNPATEEHGVQLSGGETHMAQGATTILPFHHETHPCGRSQGAQEGPRDRRSGAGRDAGEHVDTLVRCW